MYLADLLNSRRLFQTVSGWPISRADDESLSDFLFRATSALIHLVRIEQLHTACIREYQGYAPQLDIRRDRIVFSSSSVFALINEIPPLLGTLRIMQNMLLPMCGKVLGLKTSMPSSLNDAVSRLHKYGLSPQVQKRTLSYWTTAGKLLKDYRDLDQHNHVIIKHVLIELQPKPKMLVFLPDNPMVKNAAKFSFHAERNALEYLPAAFQQLHDYAEDLAHMVGSTPKEHNASMRMSQLDLLPPKGGTIGLILDFGGDKAIELSQLPDCRLQAQQRVKQ